MLHAQTKQAAGLPIVANGLDPEAQLVQEFTRTIVQAGLASDPTAAVNFYVALKSKPLAILAGPPETGKLAVIQCLARVLTGGGCDQCQFMAGHPWNAGSSANMAFFTDLHTRYNSEKLLCLIEEAWQPKNAAKVYLACLAHISRAEVATLFSEIAFQVRYGHIMQFGDVHFSTPLPYPSNLFLVATMDVPWFDQWDQALLSSTTVIPWHETAATVSCPGTSTDPFTRAGEQFLAASIRSLQAVYQKLHDLLPWEQHPMEPFFELEDALVGAGAWLPQTAIQEAMTYVANAWSSAGEGLFDVDPAKNLKIAVDLAIAQALLPYTAAHIQSAPSLYRALASLLESHYPHSALMLNNLVDR